MNSSWHFSTKKLQQSVEETQSSLTVVFKNDFTAALAASVAVGS
jgi:hypothetical protein